MMSACHQRTFRIWRGRTLLYLSLSLAPIAQADSKTWIGGTSAWDNPNAWSPTGIPQSADNVFINQAGAIVTYQNPSSPSGQLSFLQIDATGSAATMNMATANLTTDESNIGDMHIGVMNQSGGSHTVTGGAGFAVGRAPDSNGTYALSGNASLTVYTSAYIGLNGTGAFTQTGGSFTLGGNGGDGALYISSGTGMGTYTISGGSITGVDLIIDTGSGGGLFKQTGGTVTFSTNVNVEASRTSTATYDLSGTAVLTDKNCFVGFGAQPSTFKQSGGTHTCTSMLYIGNGQGGDYILSGGTLITANTNVGTNAKGKFEQNGGTHTISGTLSIGSFSGPANQDTYALSAGTLSSLGMQISPTGFFNQTGGSNDAQSLTMFGTSTYKLAGGSFRTTTLSLETGKSKLDLTNRALLLDYASISPLSDIKAFIKAAYSAGPWTGAGITSTIAAAHPSTGAVGYGEAKDILGLTGNATANWQGYTVDATSILIRYTRVGDANLDGMVSFDDLVKVAQNYGKTSGAATWSQGDFNYDGNVDFADLVKVAQNYGEGLPASIPQASPAFESDWSAALASAKVPEPGLIAPLLLALVWTRRRYTRQTRL